jgi:hypothetical protein
MASATFSCTPAWTKFLYAGMDEAPTLHLSRSHSNNRHELPVDESGPQRAQRLGETLDPTAGVVCELLQDENLLRVLHTPEDGNGVQIAVGCGTTLDNECARHAAGELDSGRAMNMSVVPECPGGMILVDMNSIILLLSLAKLQQHVVAFELNLPGGRIHRPLRRHMKAVCVQVGYVETERLSVSAMAAVTSGLRLLRVSGERIRLWQLVDQPQMNRVAWLRSYGWSYDVSVVGPESRSTPGDRHIGIVDEEIETGSVADRRRTWLGWICKVFQAKGVDDLRQGSLILTDIFTAGNGRELSPVC